MHQERGNAEPEWRPAHVRVRRLLAMSISLAFLLTVALLLSPESWQNPLFFADGVVVVVMVTLLISHLYGIAARTRRVLRRP